MPAIFEHGTGPANRLFRLIAIANRNGIQIRGWKNAQKVRLDDLRASSGPVLRAVQRELAP